MGKIYVYELRNLIHETRRLRRDNEILGAQVRVLDILDRAMNGSRSQVMAEDYLPRLSDMLDNVRGSAVLAEMPPEPAAVEKE